MIGSPEFGHLYSYSLSLLPLFPCAHATASAGASANTGEMLCHRNFDSGTGKGVLFYFCVFFDSLGSDTGKVGSDTEKVGPDTRKVGSDTPGKAGSDTGKAGSDTGKAVSDLGKVSFDTGKVCSDRRKVGSDMGKVGSDTGKVGSVTVRMGQSNAPNRGSSSDEI